jgi:hypothetical protein
MRYRLVRSVPPSTRRLFMSPKLSTSPCVLIAALLLSGCDHAKVPTESSTAPTAVQALAASVEHQTERFSFVAGGFNPCTGEETPGTGEFFSHTTLVARPSGGFHVAQVFNVSFVLTGATTGDRYLGRDVEHVNFTTNGGAQSVNTFIANVRVGTAGPGNDFVLRVRFHVTVNANGVVTVERDETTIECR